MLNNSVYLDILMRLLQMAFIDKIDLQSIEADEAFDIISEQTKVVTELAVSEGENTYISDALPIGYLAKDNREWRIAIPWPLVDSTPSDEILAEFCQFASGAQIGQDSLICLSGTSARAGGISEIGDVDFAEYLFDDKSAIPGRFTHILTSASSFMTQVEVKIFSKNIAEQIQINCPWPVEYDQYTEMHDDFLNKVTTFQTKMEFIGFSLRYGYIPVTNMILPCDSATRKSGVASASFSFQEAVFLRGNTHRNLWPLLDIREFVFYIQFLINDSQRYLDKRPLKAAKRASALARMLQIGDFDLAFSQILNSEYATNEAISYRISEVRKSALKRSPPADSENAKIMLALDAVIANNLSMYGDLAFEQLKCRRTVEQLLTHIRSKVGSFDPQLERHLFGVSA